MAINTGNYAKLLYPGLNMIYGHNYSEYPLECLQIFENQPTTRAYEEDLGITGFGMASVKSEGNSISYDTEQQAFLTRYLPTTYGIGFIITEEMMDDDLYDVVGRRRTKGIAYSMRQTKETVHANVLNRAFNTAYLGGDGATLIASTAAGSASHPNASGGSWTNGPTTNADLSPAALEQAVIDISKIKDDRGKKMAVKARQLIIHTDLQFEAERILQSVLRPSTTDNDTNALYTMGSIPKIVINHYLVDSDAWFVQTDIPEGLKTMMRKEATFAIDNEFNTGNARFKAQERYVPGWTDPRCIYGNSGL